MKAHKIVVLGDFGVGKTSLVRRYVLNEFSGDYRATLGVHLHKHSDSVEVHGSAQDVDLVLWDIEGAPLPGEQTMRYIAGASGAVVVGDLTRPDMTDPMHRAAELFESRLPGRPIGFAFNKSDIASAPEAAVLDSLRERYGAAITCTSAKTGEAVGQLFRDLAVQLLSRKA